MSKLTYLIRLSIPARHTKAGNSRPADKMQTTRTLPPAHSVNPEGRWTLHRNRRGASKYACEITNHNNNNTATVCLLMCFNLGWFKPN